jgi:vacuolar-type H+-ATPase subunit I/STV1
MTPRTANFAAALLLPLAVQAALVILSKEALLSALLDGYRTLIASTLAGFIFVIREYRWWSVIVALAYIPAMLLILVYFSFLVVGAVYGDAP